LKVKKILSRFYVKDISQAIEFYEKLFEKKCTQRFRYEEVNLELATVGDVLIICGSDEALKPFRDTQATFLVDSIEQYKNILLKNNATIIRDLKEVPTGINMTIRHSDGNIVEYVELRS